jgi:hypothetical protein
MKVIGETHQLAGDSCSINFLTLIKDIPRAKTGVYASMTADQIMAIPDREERHRAMQENIELFS